MKLDVQIRRAGPADFAARGDAFHTSVREGARKCTEAQRAARLAETPARPPGFMTPVPDDYVVLACILAEAQGQGLVRRLCEALEREAGRRANVRLWTDASRHAKGPLRAVGFTAAYAETVEPAGERLKRLRREKTLHG